MVHGPGEVSMPRAAQSRQRAFAGAAVIAAAALCGPAALLSLAAPSIVRSASSDPALSEPRSFTLRYAVDVNEISQDARRIDVWLPVPQTDEDQEITSLRVDAPIAHNFEREDEYGNLVLKFEGHEPIPSRIPIVLEATVTRRPRVSAGRADPSAAPVLPRATAHAERFLAPDRLVPVSGVIRDVALEVAGDKPTNLEKARAIYDYVTATMRYDKNGEGWGRGDALRACDVRAGNCTDFHALFIGMCRAVGVPAMFQIGFSIPEGKRDGTISSYHCWAEFFEPGKGWVPVDCSEATKNTARREFYFGSLDPNRVLFTNGRDIRVEGLAEEPLNYFIDPIVHVDGRRHEAVSREVSFVERG